MADSAPRKNTFTMPARQYSPGTLLGCLTVSFGLWVVLGVLGYRAPPMTELGKTEPAHAVILSLYCVAQFFLLLIAHSESVYRPSSLCSGGGLFSAAALGALVTTAFCIATAEMRSLLAHAFFINGGLYVGCAVETATCIFTNLEHQLSA
jgi:hypothetical protein